MNRIPGHRFRLTCLAGCFVAACHSDPYPVPPHGAVGPRVAGPEAFLTSGTNGTWTTDGAGILYTDSCLTIPPVPFGSIHGMAMQPATGGSATWVRCENRAPLIFSRDSDELFFTPALNPKGKLLYIEAVGYNVNAPIPCLCLPFPNGWHADLWTDDSGFAPGTRRRLMTLYRDHLGVVTDTLAVNWLSDVTWSGDNTFIALAGNLHPPIVLNSFGVFRGIIAGTASISLVDGTSGARLFSLARAGATIVFVNDSLTIREISSTGGAVSVVAKIPVGDERYIRDLSCVADRCLVITSDGARPPQTFWSVTLTTGTIAILRIDDRGSTRARLSPDGTRVLVTAPSGVYLYSDLRP